jgi:hypothetical protein
MSKAYAPLIALDGVLVEGMGQRGTELIVGARNDPEWGPVILAGFGGVMAEFLQDARLLPPDLTHAGDRAPSSPRSRARRCCAASADRPRSMSMRWRH